MQPQENIHFRKKIKSHNPNVHGLILFITTRLALERFDTISPTKCKSWLAITCCNSITICSFVHNTLFSCSHSF